MVKLESTLLSVAVIVEEDAGESRRIGWVTSSEEEVKKAVLAAIAVLLRDRPHVKVEWAWLTSSPLDGKPWFGRCAVCDRWVFDAESDCEPAEVGCRGARRLMGGSAAMSICPTGILCASWVAVTTALFPRNSHSRGKRLCRLILWREEDDGTSNLSRQIVPICGALYPTRAV